MWDLAQELNLVLQLALGPSQASDLEVGCFLLLGGAFLVANQEAYFGVAVVAVGPGFDFDPEPALEAGLDPGLGYLGSKVSIVGNISCGFVPRTHSPELEPLEPGVAVETWQMIIAGVLPDAQAG